MTVFSLGMKSWVPYLSVTSTLCRFDDTADDSLGHARAGVAFVDGTCSHCKSVAMGIYNLSAFFMQKVTSVVPYPGPSATMHKTSAASAEGNLRVPMETFP